MIRKSLLFAFVAGLFSLAGCSVLFGPSNPPGPGSATATPIVVTATSAPLNPTATSAAAIPTETLVSQGGPAGAPTFTPLPPVVPPTAVPPSHGDGACTYRATFIADVSVPDNSPIAAGAPFIKIWRLRNDGTCSWGPSFGLHSVVNVGGSFSGPTPSVELTAVVNQGQLTDISVPLTAPSTPGIYRSDWKLKVDNSPSGTLLVGVGAGSVPVYAQIVVPAGGPTAVPSARITFAPGATQAFVNGNLPAGGTRDYLIGVNGGQTMILTLTSPVSGNPKLSVFGTTGPAPQVINANPDGSYWLGTLPTTQDYIIRVTGAAAISYSLNVVVPQRISFAPGAITKTVTGNTAARRTVTYLLKANALQMMTVTLGAPPGVAAITIYGLMDGQPLVRAVSGAQTWTGQLPATQDYVIEVVPATDLPFGFALTTTVQ